MVIEIPRNIDKRDYLLQVTFNCLVKFHENYSEQLLGEFMTEDKIKHEIEVMNNDLEIRIPFEIQDTINNHTEDEVLEYIDKEKTKERGYENNFVYIIHENEDIFSNFLEVKQNSYNKTNCKELLIDSIKVYKTKYNDDMYIKTDNMHYKYIGNCHEDVYSFFEKMYKDTPVDLQRFIPFSSFVNRNKIKDRIFESLEPNRHILLFDDCVLNVSTGKEYPYETITYDTIPFSVIEGTYKQKSNACYEFVTNLINKLVEEPNILKAILYSLVNKDELVKSAIFNIQKSGKGKTRLLDPFKQIGILITAKSKTLEKYLELETLFRQKLIVNFEEIQDANIQGSDFNSLIDDSAITTPRKHQKSIEIPAKIKPAIIINGEDLPDFKGRTRGTLNRFSIVPLFVNEITEEDAEFIKANGFMVGIEMLRYLMHFKLNTTKEQRKDWLLSCKITEKKYLELRESKTTTIFKYIKENPEIMFKYGDYCISEKILGEMIVYLQDKNILTVNLFNKESSIKNFIKKEVINGLDYVDDDGYMTQVKRKKVKKHDTSGTHVIKYCLQLTDEGKKLVEEMGYDLQTLEHFD